MDQPAQPFHHRNKPASTNTQQPGLLAEIARLLKQVEQAYLPLNLKEDVKESLERLNRAMKLGPYQVEYEQTAKYVEWVVSLPWSERSKDNLDLEEAKKILDKNHYGLPQLKDRILEYLAVLKLQLGQEKTGVVKLTRSPVICLVGLPGTGKTSFGESIAEALNREFVRIPMGGMSNPLIMRGQSRSLPESEPGLVIKNLRRASTKNPVLLLDEIDSTAKGAQSDIMGVLLELLDPEQNFAFTDYYIDYPFDLSEVLFICSANQAGNITGAVMDRLEIILMPRYTDEDKIHIARDFLLPREFKNVGLLPSVVTFTPDVWPHVIKPFGFDIDVRSLQRTINAILRKVGRKFVEGKVKQVTISPTNLNEYLPLW